MKRRHLHHLIEVDFLLQKAPIVTKKKAFQQGDTFCDCFQLQAGVKNCKILKQVV
jgi:hypothetical protein